MNRGFELLSLIISELALVVLIWFLSCLSWCVQLWMRHTEFKNENESSSRMRTNSRTEEPGENARNWDKRRTLPSKYTKHEPCYCYIFGDHRPTSLSALAVRACRLPLRESWSTYHFGPLKRRSQARRRQRVQNPHFKTAKTPCGPWARLTERGEVCTYVEV